jgi:pimeloyl-ACP methyl ester carboxylesterase
VNGARGRSGRAYASGMDRANLDVAMDERGAGEPLGLIHGVGANRGVWHQVLVSVAADALVLALDMPGFGDSRPAGPGFDLDVVGDQVARAVLARAGGPFHLVGHSLGGALAVRIAARHPDRVRSLVLMAPAGFAPRNATLAGALGRGSAAFLAARRLARPLAGNGTARRLLLWGAVADGARLSADDAVLMIGASATATRVRQAVEAVVAADLTASLEALEMPVGLLWGERDRVVPVATARRLLAARPGTPMEVIADAGHVPQLERPDAFVAALGRVRSRLSAITA